MRSRTINVKRSRWFLSAFSASETSKTDNYRSISVSSFASRVESKEEIKAFFSRRIVWAFSAEFYSLDILKKWAEKIELKLKSLISIKKNKHRVLFLLYQYRHLNSVDLTDLSCTDIITHNVDLISKIKSYAVKSQKKWFIHTEWWIQKIIQNDIDEEIYEYTQSVNDRLFSWNARAVIIDKIENSTSENESRITFDYFRVKEVMSGIYMKLSSKVHDILSDFRHDVLFMTDFKYVYSIILLLKKCRHYFVSTISEIDQIQSTRMQQDFMRIEFILTKSVYKTFECISVFNSEFSLLHFSDSQKSAFLTFYMNDFFEKFSDFESLFIFLRDHFFSRIEWAKFRLSFKKLQLFMNSMRALEITHSVSGHVSITFSKAEKIVKWSVSIDAIEIRAFIEFIDIIRRWIKNFMKISRSLTRLMKKMIWKWIESEQLSFEILRMKCSTAIQMHDIDFSRSFQFYTDASGFDEELIVTQHQNNSTDKLQKRTIEMLILYDAFSLSRIQRIYSTYKKKLCVLIKFVMKYDYMCKHLYNMIIIHIDHRSLTRFLKSDFHEEIYEHWANQLKRLNIDIKYISKFRNKMTDELFRTIFSKDECLFSEDIKNAWWKCRKIVLECERMTKRDTRNF